ncbi:hypothetical protein D1872_306260 [compost metagenome]
MQATDIGVKSQKISKIRYNKKQNPLIYYACERLCRRDNGEALVNEYSNSEGSTKPSKE